MSVRAHRHLVRTPAMIATLAIVLLALLTAATPAAFAAQPSSKSLYIVQLAEPPVVAYDGGVAGLAATRPAKGGKIDPNSAKVRDYVRYLEGKHDAKVNGVGGAKVYSYKYSFNGFAAELSAAQAAKLRADGEVLAVSKNELLKLDTVSTPAFLGLSAPGGLWSQLSGQSNGSPIRANGPNSSGAGEGVIVGIVDSGIWPENPSFSDRDASGNLVFQQIPGWHGKCTPGEAYSAANCNQKLIGAQWYGAGFGGPAGIKATFDYEFNSARGADGHGSHTASTAAGNYGVDAIVDGVNLGKISGMAPRARIAVYKACWGFGSDPAAGCATVDTVAAIDQAVADGVDVINYSISGSRTSFLDPVEVAFLFAADAGVFVAASAGNSGPTVSTVAHNSPWVATVAAGTHDRQYLASVTLGNGATYTGAGLGAAVPSSPLILSTAAGKAGESATAVRLCFSGTLDPAKVAGKIVVCDRGSNARTDKSYAVKLAGGVGMILANTSPNSLNADFHYVPTVHVSNTDGDAIKAYVNSIGSPTASLAKGEGGTGAQAPDVASFSSRGPALAGTGDLLKPDIMAPGVDVLAVVSPIEAGRNFDFLSGTSMSSPHIAGIAALFKQKYPTWSPAAIKSALMTSASQTRNNGTLIPGTPFDFGAGQVTPNKGIDPGLVYDSGWTNWLGFLCGTGQLAASYCPQITIDPSDLNYASIAIGYLAGEQTVTRTVKNVSTKTETYNVSGLVPGMNVQVTPASFSIAPGATKELKIKITQSSAPLDTYSHGSLTLTGDKGHVVRSPISVRPVAIGAPASVSSAGGPINYNVTFGYSGSFTASARGLVPAATSTDTVTDLPTNDFIPGGADTKAFQVNVPAGTTYARFSLFDEFTDGADDLDLYVYRNGQQVGSSGSGTSAEEVSLVNPAAGTYTVYVHAWQTDGPDAQFTLFSWVLGGSAAGNMTVSAPASATTGATGAVNLTFSGLSAGTKYLGAVAYSDGVSTIGTTIVRVDP